MEVPMADDTTRAPRPPSGFATTADDYKTSRPPTMSGLGDDEARSFHRMFITSFIAFTLVAAVAHWAVWQWRPWIPGVAGYPVAAQTAPGITR